MSIAEPRQSLDTLAAAMRYAGLGFAVLPMHWPTAQWACSCGCSHPKCWRRAKHPLVPVGMASCDPAVIEEWWARWPEANVGISVTRLLVLDADVRKGRAPDLEQLAARWSFEPDQTIRSQTGSGGTHLLFQRPERRHSRGKERLGAGLDVQSGPRDFVVAPPSRHYNLNQYEWLPGLAPWERELGPVPAAMLKDLTGFPPPGWLLHVAPYWASDRLHLSVETRHRIRRLLRMH